MAANGMLDWLDANRGKRYANFINGEWVGAVGGGTYPLYEAARPDRKLGDFPDSGEADVERAVQAAHEAFRAWRETPGAARAALLHRFADLLEQSREMLAYMLSAEQGKVLAESLGEVKRAADEARFAAGEALRMEGRTSPGAADGVNSAVIRYPIGVVAAIAPWNFPIVTPVRKIAPALAYGCTIVYKPASATPWTSVRLMELLREAGAPPGVVNMVIGSGAAAGDPLVGHPLVQGISFTGSTALGRRINVAAAGRLARTQLELGGKNAAIVLDCDDLDAAARQIVSAAFACTGQRCTAISRVIVLKERAAATIEALQRSMAAIRVGPAWEEGATMGPLINKAQYDTAAGYIAQGQAEGARLAFGGERVRPEEGGWYMSPALLTGVTKEMTVAREEIFGPVLSVLEADGVEEAVELANATDYGLAAAVFTNRLDLAERLTAALECGMIHMNHGTASQPHLPFGGLKQSGFGPFSIGSTNLEFYTGMKTVYTKSRV